MENIEKFQCNNCKKKFNDLDKLHDHVSKNHAVLSCNLCDKICGTELELENHISKEHAWDCDYCDEIFLYKEGFNDHLLEVHGVVNKCDYCSLAFETKVLLKIHVQQTHRLVCEVCEEIFRDEAAFTSHKLEQHSLKCYFCNERFKTTNTFFDHLNARHGTVNFTTKGSTTQPNDGTPKDESLKEKPELLVKKCIHCHKIFPYEYLEEHVSRKHMFKCKLNDCLEPDRIFHTKQSLAIHEVLHLTDKSLICRICLAPYRRRDSLTRHLRAVHNIISDQRKINMAVSKPITLIKRIPSLRNVERGKPATLIEKTINPETSKSVSEERPPCPICGSTFSHIRNLRRHIRDTHLKYGETHPNNKVQILRGTNLKGIGNHGPDKSLGSPQDDSEDCFYEVEYLDEYLLERSRIESGKSSKPHTSDAENHHSEASNVDGQCFIYENSKNKSYEVEFLDELSTDFQESIQEFENLERLSDNAQAKSHVVGDYMCEKCAATFENVHDLEVHDKQHICTMDTNAQESLNHSEDYKCGECPAIFKSPYELEQHGKIHIPKTETMCTETSKTDTNSFQCLICNLGFSSNDEFEAHSKNHIKLEIGSLIVFR